MASEGRIDVPGTSLFYRIQGTGPLLLFIQGADGIADGGAIVDALSTAYTVITYDPRGLSRSVVERTPHDLRLETHGDDAHHLLSALTSEPVLVFGFSRGALVALDLVPRYGSQATLPRRCAIALGTQLGVPVAEFPGGHGGPTTHPKSFAARLGEILGAAIKSERENGEE